MRILLSGLLMVATLSWLPAQALAQDPGQRPPRPGAGGGPGGDQDPGGRPPRPEDFGPDDFPPPPPPPNLIFLALDLDKDGEISSKELAKAATSLAKLDKNKDGVITEDEVRPPPPGGRRGPGGPGGFDGPPGGGPPGGARSADPKALVESVMKMDKNNDGKISAQELPERMSRLMTEGDTNKNGFLERSEVEALSKKQGTQSTPRRPGPPGGGPPGGGPPPGGPQAGNGNEEDHGRPVELVARELGVTPEKFREVFRKVRPAGPGQQPTEAQRQQNRQILSEGLGVSPERLDEVMDKYRPGGRVDNGAPVRPPIGDN